MPWTLAVMMVALATSTAAEPPRVEVLDSRGALDGPKGAQPGPPTWSRVRLALEVQNHLDVAVRDLVLDLVLLGAGGEPIPGWTFRGVRVDATVGPRATQSVRLDRRLPKRRRSPPAREIAYRITVTGYRADPPSLALAFELLGSGHPSDQRAALSSFERDPTWPDEKVTELSRVLRSTLRGLPDRPSATDALRLLLAVRAIGTLELAADVPSLLDLPERLDREAWGRAVLDLASRMVVASAPDDPRLGVLPRWARRVATLLRVNAKDALPEAVQDAILRIGDEAVPSLMRVAHLHPHPAVRRRAGRLVERHGRASPRAQIAVAHPSTRLDAIDALGEIGRPEAVPALIEALAEPDPVAGAAGRALLTLGGAAIPRLAEALGRPGDERVRWVLARSGAAHERELREVSRQEGLDPDRALGPGSLVDAIARARREARRARLEAEVRDAIALGAQGAYRAALERLDRVYAEDPELYMEHADPIARLYVARAEGLLERGDYDMAIRVLSDGQTVRPLPEAEMRLTDARVALARGFLELGDLDRTQAELDAVPLPSRGDVVAVRRDWLEAAARQALAEGQDGRARRWIDQARALDPDDIRLRLLDRQVALREHLAVTLTLALTFPALALALALLARRRVERRRIERIAAALEATPEPHPLG